MTQAQWNQGYHDGRTDAELGLEPHPGDPRRTDYYAAYERGYQVGKGAPLPWERRDAPEKSRDPE